MKAKKSKKSGGNLNLAAFFLAAIFFLILFSFLVKFFIVFNQSKVNGKSPVNILVQGQENAVLAISPAEKKLSVILIKEDIDRKSASNLLGIAIDANINSESIIPSKGIKEEISDILLDYREIKTDLNFFDRVRIFIFVKSLSQDSIQEDTISVNSSKEKIDTVISPLVSDKNIQDEGKSVEVINASGIDGAGSNLARTVTNMGGNVILVSTSQDVSQESFIGYKGEKSYTVDRFSDVFNFEAKEYTGNSIADVIIVVGKNFGEGL